MALDIGVVKVCAVMMSVVAPSQKYLSVNYMLLLGSVSACTVRLQVVQSPWNHLILDLVVDCQQGFELTLVSARSSLSEHISVP
jgi:hypothetical protein